MTKFFTDLSDSEIDELSSLRDWACAQGLPDEHIIVAGKLDILQRTIDSGAIGTGAVWKMNALGVMFGDALTQALEGRLHWVVAEDDKGRTFALSWQRSEGLIFPLDAIRSRLSNGEPLDVHGLYAEYRDVFPK